MRGHCLEAGEPQYGPCAEEIPKHAFYDVPWLVRLFAPRARRLRIIVTDRDFANTVASHRTWDGGIESHARVMAAYRSYLSAQLEGPLHAAEWRLLRYERLDGSAATTGAAAQALAALFGWRTNITQAVHSTDIRPSTRNSSAELAAAELGMIRSIEAAHQWGAYRRTDVDLI